MDRTILTAHGCVTTPRNTLSIPRHCALARTVIIARSTPSDCRFQDNAAMRRIGILARCGEAPRTNATLRASTRAAFARGREIDGARGNDIIATPAAAALKTKPTDVTLLDMARALA
jgi:hypothetical protein